MKKINKTNCGLNVIVGLGKTGLSCVRYLSQKGADFVVTDSRQNPPGLKELRQNFPEVKTYLGGFDEKILSQASELIVSPGVSLSEPAIVACLKKGIRPIGDIELFALVAKKPIIAITGSNGKSTVTSLIDCMAQTSGKKVGTGGNLGTPALDLLKQDVEFYILELSSFQLETTYSLQADVAVILNVSQDHMDRYQNLNEYLAAKQRIYSGCRAVVVNRDDPAGYANVILPKEVISFGCDKPNSSSGFGLHNNYLMCGDCKLLHKDELKIKGLHNISNTLAALALGTSTNLPVNAMLLALKNFPGLPHRGQWVAKINGVSYYNDSKGTNVGATKAAIEGFGADNEGKIVLIAGGIGKGADFSLLRDTVARYVRTMVLIGKDASLIQQALTGACKILLATSMSEAVEVCALEARPKDIVLLSPACASFDMFDNFEHRGDVFTEMATRIKK